MPAWILLTKDEPLVYEKELIHEGTIYRKGLDGKLLKLNFTPEFLKHVLDNFVSMSEVGVKVPLYLRHVLREENRLGTVLDMSIRKNKRGHEALFIKAQFSDEKARDLALKSDVSIGLIEEYMDPKGNTYKWAMDHVASTDRPNVPGLEGYVAIAASLDTIPLEEMKMEELLAALELELDPAMSDEDKLKAVITKIEELKAAAKKAEGGEGEGSGSTEPPQQMSGSGNSIPGSSGGSSVNPSKVTVQFSVPSTMIRQANRVRQGQLQSLLEAGKITPDTCKQLTSEYCTEKALRLSFEQDDTAFDRLIEVLEKNPVSLAPQGGKELRLSGAILDDEDLLAKDAEEMAKR